MRVDIIQKGKPLRCITHKGKTYVMAPKRGQYTLKVHNDCERQRLAVVTVDGVNVIDGKDGNHEGQGYVMRPWETLDIPGWRRDDDTVAAFTFKPEKKSYANKTGRGVNNVGVIGLAVFEETPLVPGLTTITMPVHHHHHHHTPWAPYPHLYWTSSSGSSVKPIGTLYTTNTTNNLGDTTYSVSSGNTDDGVSVNMVHTEPERTRGPIRRRRKVTRALSEESIDIGTGYGQELEFETTSVSFDRATETPALVVALFYASRQRLESWGIPIKQMKRPESRPNPFPQSGPSVPAPPGWRG